MSAYICNPEVIATIAAFAADKGQLEYGNTYRYTDLKSAGSVAIALAKENIRSIGYRYPDTKGKEAHKFMPSFKDNDAYLAECAALAEAKPHRNVMLSRLFELVREYDYQACECDNWYKTKAWNICAQVNKAIAAQAVEQLSVHNHKEAA